MHFKKAKSHQKCDANNKSNKKNEINSANTHLLSDQIKCQQLCFLKKELKYAVCIC